MVSFPRSPIDLVRTGALPGAGIAKNQVIAVICPDGVVARTHTGLRVSVYGVVSKAAVDIVAAGAIPGHGVPIDHVISPVT